MKMQDTFGIFDEAADHLIELVRRHAPLAQIRAAGCPACGAALSVTFAGDGRGFLIACEGKPLHVTTHQEVADPPPWWRECVAEPADATWYWRVGHSFDAAGNLSMPVSGWQADGVRWSGGFACPVDHPDHAFWRWVLSGSGCTSDLIGDAELAELRERFAHQKGGGTMTQDEFLRDPVAVFVEGRMEGVPDDWVRQAWDAQESDPERSLRLFITGDIEHEANSGCLPLIAGQLRWLGQVLRADQWGALYRDVRDQEPHRESEIREEFVRAAPDRQTHLPPPLTREEVVSRLGQFGFDEATAAELMGEESPDDQAGDDDGALN